MLAHDFTYLIKMLIFYLSDDCEDKPCLAKGSCALNTSDVCNCNEPLRFDDDYNCVGQYESFL